MEEQRTEDKTIKMAISNELLGRWNYMRSLSSKECFVDSNKGWHLLSSGDFLVVLVWRICVFFIKLVAGSGSVI